MAISSFNYRFIVYGNTADDAYGSNASVMLSVLVSNARLKRKAYKFCIVIWKGRAESVERRRHNNSKG